MLTLLPRNLLEYILSIVVYEYFCSEFAFRRNEVGLNVKLMRNSFNLPVSTSRMAMFVLDLRLVHSQINRIFLSVCKREEMRWGFDDRFFHTLVTHRLRNSETKKIES